MKQCQSNYLSRIRNKIVETSLMLARIELVQTTFRHEQPLMSIRSSGHVIVLCLTCVNYYNTWIQFLTQVDENVPLQMAMNVENLERQCIHAQPHTTTPHAYPHKQSFQLYNVRYIQTSGLDHDHFTNPIISLYMQAWQAPTGFCVLVTLTGAIYRSSNN